MRKLRRFETTEFDTARVNDFAKQHGLAWFTDLKITPPMDQIRRHVTLEDLTWESWRVARHRPIPSKQNNLSLPISTTYVGTRVDRVITVRRVRCGK
jgi:hypothetical protein